MSRPCIQLSEEVESVLLGAPARCGLGGQHRASAGAACPSCRRTKPEQLRGRPLRRARILTRAGNATLQHRGESALVGSDVAKAELVVSILPSAERFTALLGRDSRLSAARSVRRLARGC